jgi:hypothetical protein
VRTLHPVDLGRVTALLPSQGRAELRSEKEFLLRFSGGDAVQSDILKTLVTGEIRVVSVEPLGADLGARYLATVGREEEA